MKFDLFIDGGGTTTKLYWCEANTKTIIKKEIFPRMNILTLEKETYTSLHQILNKLKPHHSLIAQVLIGIPGYKNYNKKSELLSFLSALPSVEIMTDAELQMHFMISDDVDNYLFLILGTGTVIITKEGQQQRIYSGWGHLLGDEGSAYDFALEFIKQAILDYENDCDSDFINAVMSYFNLTNFEDIKFLYSSDQSTKLLFSKFANWILLENPRHYTNAKKIIFNRITTKLVTWISQINNLQTLSKVFVSGGLLNSQAYYQMLTKKLAKYFASIEQIV